MENEEGLLGQVEFEPESDAIVSAAALAEPGEGEKPAPPIPAMSDTGWSDYVMTKFDDDELIEGCPTVDGLRRVAELVLGNIINSVTNVVEAPNQVTNNGRATVTHCISIAWDQDRNDIRTFSDAADVYPGNADAHFAIFPTAMAATRAEGRALRKALRLKRVVTAEEIATNPIEDNGSNGKIDRAQKRFIDVLAKRNNINVMKYINAGQTKYASIDDVESRVAQKMVKFLSDCQQDHGKIKPEWKGYDSDWNRSKE